MPKKQRSTRKASPAGPEHSRPEQVREEIRALAYELYCQCGHEDGHDLDHWMEAERRVLAHHAHPKSRGQRRSNHGAALARPESDGATV